MRRWCRATVCRADGSTLAEHVLEGPGEPDLATVDELARLALHATRLGGALVLDETSPAMAELLALTGLAHLVAPGRHCPRTVTEAQEGDRPR